VLGEFLLIELRGHLGGGHNILCQGRKPNSTPPAASRFFSAKNRANNQCEISNLLNLAPKNLIAARRLPQ
jgi:hypothetical protein